MPKPEYFRIGGPRRPTVLLKNKVANILNEPSNPIFNFGQSFVDNLQNVSAIKLGQSVPFIKLDTLNADGSELVNVSTTFFNKTVDMDKISEGRRFSNRPTMSLKDISIDTDLAYGYLYLTRVIMTIKVHSPEALNEGDGVLMHLMIPGVPLKLEYGWRSPDTFLDQTEKLLFQVKDYNINIDTTGQVELRLEGYAFNETFNNVIIGDEGLEIESETIEKAQAEGILKITKKNKHAIETLKKVLDKNGNGINPDLIKDQAEELLNMENRIRNTILEKKYRNAKRNLKFQVVNFGKGTKHKANVITLHDLISTLLGPTLEHMTSIFSGAKKFRVIYGNFNDNAGKFHGQSVANFPIRKEKLLSLLKEDVSKGQFIPTVGKLFNFIQGDFMENTEYWTGLAAGANKKVFNMPDIAINLANHNINGEQVVDLQIIDTKSGLPITTAKMGDKIISPAEFEKKVLEGTSNFPIIKLGHANSFIKTMSMSQITDQFMKSVLIERMYRNRISTIKSTKLQSKDLTASGVNPLTLPLKGTASVLGHIGWKPFRAFFLSSGIYTISAIYKITKVSHKLSAEGFNTNIEFMYH